MCKEMDSLTVAIYSLLITYSALGLKIISTEEKSCKVTTDKGKIDLSPLAGNPAPRSVKVLWQLV